MIYQYQPNDPQRYATNLRREQGKQTLTWDHARGQDVILIQTPFRVNAAEKMEEICQAMTEKGVNGQRYTEVLPGIWARYVSATDKAKQGGCPLNAEASTYAVFACEMDGGTCNVYAPQEKGMIRFSCDIPMELHVDVIHQVRREGLFKKREVPTGYYTLVFPEGFVHSLRDGDLAYKVDGFKIPVTRKMVEQGTVFVKSEIRPEMVSCNKGVKLI